MNLKSLAILICIVAAVSSTNVQAQNSETTTKSNQIRTAPYEKLLNRANQLYRQEKFAQAIILYRKAENRGLQSEVAAMNIGKSYYRVQDYASAAAAFRRAVRMTENQYAPALFNLAATLYRLGEYGECISVYHQGLALVPQNSGAWLYLAEAYQKTGDLTGVQKSLEKARAIDPDDVGIVYQLSELHVSLQEYDRAVEFVRQAYALMPEEIDFLFYMGDLYRLQGKNMEAAASYREGLGFKPNNIQVLYKLADALSEADKPYLAVGYLQKAVKLKPDFVDAWIFLGNISSDQQWFDRASDAYIEAAKQGSEEGIQGLRNLVYDLEKKKNWEAAEALIVQGLSISPKHPDLKTDLEAIRSRDQ
jgi:tetratricopeptide (TPR) repeat protein